MPWPGMVGQMSEPDVEVNSTLKPVPRNQANLEAEKGETATVPGAGGVPSTFKIGGKRHSEGGTPLNLPEDSFIYSDTKNMKIKDQKILAQFGINKKGSYTPAEISKKYDVNQYKKILADPDTDDLQRKTAEGMIANNNMKLAKLALLQESIKGFPTGIPVVAMPYVESMAIDPSQFIMMNPQAGQQAQPAGDNMRYGGTARKFQGGGNNVVVQPKQSDRVIYNAQTGQYEVQNRFGKKIGILNPPGQQPGNVVGKPMQPTYSQGQGTNPVKGQTRGDWEISQGIISENDSLKSAIWDGTKWVDQKAGTTTTTTKTTTPKKMSPDDHINLISTKFSDPAIQQYLYDKTLAAANNPSNKGRNIGFKVETRNGVQVLVNPTTGQVMSPADISNNFIEMQSRNIKTNSILQESGISYDCFHNTTGKLIKSSKCKDSPYNSLDEVFQATGIGSPTDDFSKGIQQASYIGYRDMINDFRTGKITDEGLMTSLEPFVISQTGVNDETGVAEDKKISKIDTYYTNTTAGQIAGVNDVVEGEEVVESPEEVLDTQTKAEHLPEQKPADLGSPWWLQDIVKTAHAAGNLARIKKYNPWQATPDVITPEVTFYDPTRELAANAEQSNIAAQTLAQFTGPQSFNARNAQIQGQALKNVADVMSRYNNQNVTISNQQAAQNANILNQASQQKAQLATTLWDKYQTVNQNFDNSKSQARDALVNQYVSAITNKNYTANMNKMFPQYAVDPSIGGEYYFHDPRELKADSSEAPTFTDLYNQIMAENPSLKAYPAKVADIAMQQLGQPMPNNPWQTQEDIPQVGYPGYGGQ
jgi:hypothetical protein